jgi:uroporphyrinogen-III synthase
MPKFWAATLQSKSKRTAATSLRDKHVHLIITRPVEDALPLQHKLEAMGHSAIILPLLEIVPYTDVSVPVKSYQAICITSANGLRNLSLPSHLKVIPIFTLGPQSAIQAKKAGFLDVRTGGGNVDGLAQFCANNIKPQEGPLLYLSGKETSGDLEGQLRARGFEVDRIKIYDAKPTTPELHQHITKADAVLLYSPRSALIWQALARTQGVDVSSMMHFCLSANVAAKLPVNFTTKISASATEADMLALLEPAKNVE